MNKSAKVLIVDDEPDMLTVVSMRLKIWGYESVCAQSGTEALEKLKAEKPYLILLDLALPDMTGDEVCRRVKTSPVTSSVPVIIISAARERLIARAKSCGADDWILKPYEPSHLFEKLKPFLPPAKEFGGSMNMEKLRPGYIKQKKELLKKIRSDIQSGDIESVRYIAHKMSGSGAMYGFDDISRIGADMEDAAAAKNIYGIRRCYAELKKTLSGLCEKFPTKNKKAGKKKN
ncbi:response regulator [bacterium]|nr:response regulator [bacterium]MBU3930178.1 response regulator [bacterium]MBU4122543.1 response regulator [bacterium]